MYTVHCTVKYSTIEMYEYTVQQLEEQSSMLGYDHAIVQEDV